MIILPTSVQNCSTRKPS